jgi:hypothetical protein
MNAWMALKKNPQVLVVFYLFSITCLFSFVVADQSVI